MTNERSQELPHSSNTERAILEACLQGTDASAHACARVVVELTPHCFYRTAHAIIFRTIKDLHDGGSKIDMLTVHEALRRNGTLDAAGGLAYLAGLHDEIAIVAHVGEYLRLLQELAVCRSVAIWAEQLRQRAIEGRTPPGDLLEQAMVQLNALQPAADGERTGPRGLQEFAHQPPEATVWVVPGYLKGERTTILAAAPKGGKTTLAAAGTVAITRGLPFLGYPTSRTKVLWLALDEHVEDVVARFRALGADESMITIWPGPLRGTRSTCQKIATSARQHDIGVIIVDTLARFLDIDDENDAGQADRALELIKQLAIDARAAVWALHHTRKGEGEGADRFRGSSAILAGCDIGLLMTATGETQRAIRAYSRYAETPMSLLVEHRRDGTFAALGSRAEAKTASLLERLSRAIPTDAARAKTKAQIRQALGAGQAAVQQLMAPANRPAWVGVTGDPRRERYYRLPTADSPYGESVGRQGTQESDTEGRRG